MLLVLYNILMAAVGILLFIAGITDIKKKQISSKFILVLALVCTAAALCKKDFGIIEAAGGVAIGLCAIGLSVASRGQIGKGDGMVMAATGLVLGGRGCLAAVSMASLLMCIVAIVVLALRKGRRGTRLAFLPALFVGYVLCLI